jgi:hypothetical protein
MAFSYSGDPTKSELDLIRFTVGDTDASDPILQDAEIDYILATKKTVSGRLALAFRQCATHYAPTAIKRKLGPQEEDPSNRLAYFREMAAKYERLSNFAGTPPSPEYDSEKIFGKDMMTNV